jgi:hypothetical protein
MMAPASFTTVVNERLAGLGRRLDLTLEHLRLGAVKGLIVTAVDRVTGAALKQLDLFASFGVTPQPVLEWPIIGAGALGQEAAAWAGELTFLINDLGRRMADETAFPLQSIRGFCGSVFFDAFTQHPDRRAAFIGYPAPALTEPVRGATVTFRDVTITEYRGQLGGVPFVAPDLCHFLPIGDPDVFVEAFAPADYVDTVNTLALPRYARQETMDFDKGVELEAQMNVLPLCTAPRALFTARATPWQPPAPPPAPETAETSPSRRAAR